jgi:hypothetical protein
MLFSSCWTRARTQISQVEWVNVTVQTVEGGHIEAVQFLLDKGADTDIPGREGGLPLLFRRW